eukprot:16431089-Heterocapsa_arctica.AAC.1
MLRGFNLRWFPHERVSHRFCGSPPPRDFSLLERQAGWPAWPRLAPPGSVWPRLALPGPACPRLAPPGRALSALKHLLARRSPSASRICSHPGVRVQSWGGS